MLKRIFFLVVASVFLFGCIAQEQVEFGASNESEQDAQAAIEGLEEDIESINSDLDELEEELPK